VVDTTVRVDYDSEAFLYDKKRYHSAEGRLFSDLEIAVLRSWLPLRRGDRVLDVPAGTGRLSFALAESGATVVGADLSVNMLRVADSKRAHEAGRPHFMQGSGAALPFPSNTFDAVISFKFFHLIPNEQKKLFIDEMVRVLKPGHPLIVEFNSAFYGGVLAALRYYLRKKHPGGMRMKCLFPDQLSGLFAGLEVRRTHGVKIPFAGTIASVLGRGAIERLDRWMGSLPALKYLSYVIIVEARKPAA
jgi:demethylmenaquinone methyltransferase/2-methoxy-6-polyprenyl-1,4-benzoquinol methylase